MTAKLFGKELYSLPKRTREGVSKDTLSLAFLIARDEGLSLKKASESKYGRNFR